MLATLLLCAALTSPERADRVESAIGADVLTGGEAPWIGEQATTWRLGAQHHLLDLIGELWLAGALSLRPGGTELGTTLIIADVGVLFELPHGGILRRLFPYARAAIEGVWVHVEAGDSYSGNAFTAGLAVGAGLRWHPAPAGRFFFSAEGAYSRRLSARVKLYDDRGEEGIRGPGTPLGELALSGWVLRAGVGLAF